MKPTQLSAAIRAARRANSKEGARRAGTSATLRLAVALLAFASLFALPLYARAQDADRPDPSMTNTPAPTYFIRGARIVTVSGADIENGSIVVSGGRISAVGASVSAPAGAQEIDARGLTVFPGMIDLGTNMGLVEVSGGAPGSVDSQELGEINPNISAIWSINPGSSHIDVTRVAGVTSVLSMPSGGTISGQAAFINLAGSTFPLPPNTIALYFAGSPRQ